MKKIISFIVALGWAVMAFAQTPEEIISRMEQVMAEHEKDGIIMTMDIKIPILGTASTTTYILGDKVKMKGTVAGADIVTWADGKTNWIYSPKENKITITRADEKKSAEKSSDTEMFSGITEGYDVSISGETDKVWKILCKKSKDNKEKDDPKTMNLVVAKGTFYPVSLSAKMSGITMTMRDLSYGVTEAQVTFNPADYPDATIEDKR
ncbi:MAG: hypothetical protein IJT26_03150 [Bacteroidales bacterium]|nr:hypothetical protein [Bacteroidales bacterium]